MTVNRKFLVVIGRQAVSQHNTKQKAKSRCSDLKKRGYVQARVYRRGRKTERGIRYHLTKKTK